MSNLYGVQLAKVFDTMYQGFIDYKEEFEFYATKADAFNVDSILELGCGTGNLAKHLSKKFKSYLGIDLSEHMLTLAREKNSATPFMYGDMRSFSTEKEFDMALITGRSTSYLLDHDDLLNTFESISKALIPQGYLTFDCIDAEKFVPYVDENPIVKHYSKVENIEFSRVSHWHVENRQSNLINWKADYFKVEEKIKIDLGQDRVLFKTFTRAEITALLKEKKFAIVSIENRSTYAFDTFVVHARKIN